MRIELRWRLKPVDAAEFKPQRWGGGLLLFLGNRLSTIGRCGVWIFIFGVFGLFITACVSNPRIESLNPSELEALARIQILEDEIVKPYSAISEVKGISCHETSEQSRNRSTDDAIEGIKMRAAQKHADAVINIVCEPYHATDWMNDCWSSIVCVGTAIKFE